MNDSEFSRIDDELGAAEARLYERCKTLRSEGVSPKAVDRDEIVASARATIERLERERRDLVARARRQRGGR